MELPYQAPLTPEQLAAVQAGDGCARFEDPTTHRKYVVIEQPEPSVDDDYIREKLAEAASDSARGDVAELDIESIKKQIRERIAAKQAKR